MDVQTTIEDPLRKMGGNFERSHEEGQSLEYEARTREDSLVKTT